MEGSPAREDIEQLLVDVKRAANVLPKQRVTKISSIIERICSTAYADGLSSASLDGIIDTVTTSSHLDQASAGSLIRNLYPVSKIPNEIVVRVVASLGHGSAKPSYATQAALLNWLVMTYDVLEIPGTLSRLYGVLFNLLDTIAIRKQLCHMLSLITRRKHVRPFRIQNLMELTRLAGNDPPLVGLMRVYKDYYPDVIVGETTSGRASVFTHPNPEWRQRLGEIRSAHLQKTQDGQAAEQRNFRVTRKGANGVKRAKTSVIPEVHTSHAQESSVTLEEIENVEDFIDVLERIEMPNQLVAAVGDPLLQRLLQLKPAEHTISRIDHWLTTFFEDQLSSPESEKPILEMLEAICHYTHTSKHLPSACLRYLQSMMDSWNGVGGRHLILDLLVYVPIAPWNELYASTFQPLEDAVLDDAAHQSKLDLLTFYRKLLQQWAMFLPPELDITSIQGSSINSLLTHANTLALTIVQSSLTVSTCSTVLDLYEAMASLISDATLGAQIQITIPPAELIYTLFFTHSLSIISRLCAILALYKRAFEIAMTPKAGSDQQPYPKEYVNHFNGFLMDICNCLWRSRAFNTSDINALGCLLPVPIANGLTTYVSTLDTSLSLSLLLGLSYSPFLCRLAISYVRELEDNAEDEIEIRHAGPVTQTSLRTLQKDGGIALSWPDYRLGVLQYLERLGAPGVGELMYNTMKHLMAARGNKA